MLYFNDFGYISSTDFSILASDSSISNKIQHDMHKHNRSDSIVFNLLSSITI